METRADARVPPWARAWLGYALGVLYCLLLATVGRLQDHDVHPQHSALTARGLWQDVQQGALARPGPGPRGLRVAGGGDANPLTFFWQAALLTEEGRFFCGGSIIDEEWILTSGQCLDPFPVFRVEVGSPKMSEGRADSHKQMFLTREKYTHPKYDMVYLDNDVGLLKLPSKIKFNVFISAVQLPTYSMAMEDLSGSVATVSGWGKTSDDSTISQILKYTDLTILSNKQCEAVYGNTVTSTKLCLSSENGNSICQGDSGGALVIEKKGGLPGEVVQIGISSFVSEEGCTVMMPQGFTRVSSYLEYIEKITGITIED
ncbi:Chymotrypsin BII [Frankliniella fusca]|uniref:Chymotrypsin BII n=1 Tax=Frankliniella fusca TaxID=407009 RepID=A0AAE1L9U6_9NEOP|nr:Chymotrypsin BII [Frankliniella fusca]